MLPFKIKICGVTTGDDAICACRAGADAIGLNFYERSSRHIDGEKAGEIVRLVDEFNRQSVEIGNTQVKKVGVFVDMPIPDMVAIAWHVGLDGIQLHGNESPKVVAQIRAELDKLDHQCILIRAVRSKPAEFGQADSKAESGRVSDEINRWMETGIDLILLDAAMPGEFGGTGKVVDLAVLPKFDDGMRIVLAGGLTPENVASAIRTSGLQSVDVASGVESSPGVKDQVRMKAFVEAARSAFREIG